jgi:hypothetical protein
MEESRQPEPANQPQRQVASETNGPEGSGLDLLSIALLDFFRSLLLIVAAMLVLPSIVQ